MNLPLQRELAAWLDGLRDKEENRSPKITELGAEGKSDVLNITKKCKMDLYNQVEQGQRRLRRKGKLHVLSWMRTRIDEILPGRRGQSNSELEQ